MSSKVKPNRRPVPSRLLERLRQERLEALEKLTPAQRMEAAFALSLEARKLSIAGMRAQGFSEAEIVAALMAKRR